MDEITVELIKLIPSLLWFLLVLIVLLVFYRPIRDDLLPSLTGFSAAGVELSFVRESIDAAVQLAQKSPQWKVKISDKDKARAVNRARKHLEIFREAQILWVDDSPENNLNERKMFRKLNVLTDTARSTGEALRILQDASEDSYDVILSDMARDDHPTAGLEMLPALQQHNHQIPVIFYIGVVDPAKGVPPGAFGITNRPDELLHLILDVLERTKYGNEA